MQTYIYLFDLCSTLYSRIFQVKFISHVADRISHLRQEM